MNMAHEEDVVIAFRQAVEEEMNRMQAGQSTRFEDLHAAGASAEEKISHLAKRQVELEHEVALLRTIVLRLVSDPVDNGNS